MYRLRDLSIATAFALVLGAIVASSSFGAFTNSGIECTNEGIPTLCLEIEGKLFEALGTETYSGKKVASTAMHLEVSAIGSLECEKDDTTGVIVQEEPLVKAVFSRSSVLAFSGGCKLAGHATCKISEPITTANLEGTVFDEMPIKFGLVKTEVPGATIATITITGCEQEAIIKITGEDLGTGIESESYKAVHQGQSTAAGSELKDGTKQAFFVVTQEVELSGSNKGKNWAVVLG
jgi:hypothetical protein